MFKQPHIIANNIINDFTTQWLLYVPPLLALQDPELCPQSTHTSHHSETALGSVLLTRYNSVDQIKKNEMAASWRTGIVHIEFWWGDPTEGDHLEDPGIDESIYQDGSSRSVMGRHGLE